tara:strand:+ start:2049 stop:2234 length:186 start_codon:yes stop_codon:yes gene_type:complete
MASRYTQDDFAKWWRLNYYEGWSLRRIAKYYGCHNTLVAQKLKQMRKRKKGKWNALKGRWE